MHKMTVDVLWLTRFFDTEPSLISNRLIDAVAQGGTQLRLELVPVGRDELRAAV